MTRLLLGLVAGAGAALLFAPKSGTDLREDLVNRGRELKDSFLDRTRELLSSIDGSPSGNSVEHQSVTGM